MRRTLLTDRERSFQSLGNATENAQSPLHFKQDLTSLTKLVPGKVIIVLHFSLVFISFSVSFSLFFVVWVICQGQG